MNIQWTFNVLTQCNPARNSILSLWGAAAGDADADTAPSPQPSEETSPSSAPTHFSSCSSSKEQFRFSIATGLFLFGSFGIAMALDDLGVVLALIGATGSTVITFILPGAAYYQLFRHEGPPWKRAGAALLFCTGVVIMPVCLVFIFI
jgi:hypothetical protein